MFPQTVGKQFDTGRVASVVCEKNPTLPLPMTKNKCFVLLMITKGKATLRLGEEEMDATSPCFVCLDEQTQPEVIKHRRLQFYAVYFHPTFLNVNLTFRRVQEENYPQMALNHDLFLLKPFTVNHQWVVPIPDAMVETATTLLAQMAEELEQQTDWYWSCRSRSYFMELMILLERVYQRCHPPVQMYSNYHLRNGILFIESRYHRPITLEQIATAATVSHTTLTQMFKKELGVTPMDYVWQYRIQIAKKQLAFTSLPLKEIALTCGFKTLPHFTRKFQQITGQCPSHYREQAVARRKQAFSQKEGTL